MCSIIWKMLIVFILMFINNSICKKVIYWNQNPCPNCEKWCAKNTNFTCNYKCEYNNIQAFFHDEWGYKDEEKIKHSDVESQEYRATQEFRTPFSKNDKSIKNFCAKMSKNYTCEFKSFYFPLCSSDFKPYDKGMDICCEKIKKCYNDKSYSTLDFFFPETYGHPIIRLTKECSGIDFDVVYPHIFPIRNNKNNSYWTISRYGGLEYFAEKCGMKCENGSLIDNTKAIVFENRERITKVEKNVRANTELGLEMKSNISDIQEEMRNEKDVNSERYKALEEKLGKALEILANHEKRITKVEYDVELLMNWKAIMESNAEESRKEAKEDEGCVGGGDDDKEGGGRKKRKAPSRGRGRGRGSGGKKGGGKGGIGDALNVVNKVKGVKDEVEKAFKDPKAYVKNKGRQLLKKGLDKGRQFLENSCDAATVGIGTVTGICEWAADGIENLATQGVNEVCKLVEKGIEAVKEGATKLFNGAKDFIGGLF